MNRSLSLLIAIHLVLMLCSAADTVGMAPHARRRATSPHRREASKPTEFLRNLTQILGEGISAALGGNGAASDETLAQAEPDSTDDAVTPPKPTGPSRPATVTHSLLRPVPPDSVRFASVTLTALPSVRVIIPRPRPPKPPEPVHVRYARVFPPVVENLTEVKK